MEVQATVVRLAPNTHVQSVSFEQAFGGESYSEARGKRQEKKAARQAARTNRKVAKQQGKTAKQAAKVERKVAKQAGKAQIRTARKEARVAPRAAAQAARQDKRTNKMAMKQERKTGRVAMRQDRRALRRGPEPPLEEEMLQEDMPLSDTEMGTADQEVTEMEPRTNPYQQGQSEETGYTEEESDVEESSAEPEGAGEEQYFEENAEESSEEEWPEEESQDEYGFDGVQADDSQRAEFADSNAVLLGVPPAIVNCANKIEWNKEKVARLTDQKAKLAAKDKNTDDVDTAICRTYNRVTELENKLKMYANFEGEFSSASGDEFIELRGKRAQNASNAQKLGRVQQIAKAKRAAGQRRAAIKGGRMQSGGDSQPTPVQASLNPEFGENRIEIPAEEKESATGPEMRAFENLGDFNETKPTTVEINSNFSGTSIASSLKNNWKGVLIGVALTGVAIWAINKYKVIDKIVK